MSISVETLALAKKNTKQAVEEAVTSVYRYRGSVETFEDLPTSGQKVGDVYNVEKEAGRNYAWDGSNWDALGIAENLGDIEFEGEGIVERDVTFDGNNDRVSYTDYVECSKAIPLENLVSNQIIIEHEGYGGTSTPYYVGYAFGNSTNSIDTFSGPGNPLQNTDNQSIYTLPTDFNYSEYKYFFLPLTHEKHGPQGQSTGEKEEYWINPIITYKTLEQGTVTKTINNDYLDKNQIQPIADQANTAEQIANNAQNTANNALSTGNAANNRLNDLGNNAFLTPLHRSKDTNNNDDTNVPVYSSSGGDIKFFKGVKQSDLRSFYYGDQEVYLLFESRGNEPEVFMTSYGLGNNDSNYNSVTGPLSWTSLGNNKYKINPQNLSSNDYLFVPYEYPATNDGSNYHQCSLQGTLTYYSKNDKMWVTLNNNYITRKDVDDKIYVIDEKFDDKLNNLGNINFYAGQEDTIVIKNASNYTSNDYNGYTKPFNTKQIIEDENNEICVYAEWDSSIETVFDIVGSNTVMTSFAYSDSPDYIYSTTGPMEWDKIDDYKAKIILPNNIPGYDYYFIPLSYPTYDPSTGYVEVDCFSDLSKVNFSYTVKKDVYKSINGDFYDSDAVNAIANDISNQANAAYDRANNAMGVSTTASGRANSAYDKANTASNATNDINNALNDLGNIEFSNSSVITITKDLTNDKESSTDWIAIKANEVKDGKITIKVTNNQDMPTVQYPGAFSGGFGSTPQDRISGPGGSYTPSLSSNVDEYIYTIDDSVIQNNFYVFIKNEVTNMGQSTGFFFQGTISYEKETKETKTINQDFYDKEDVNNLISNTSNIANDAYSLASNASNSAVNAANLAGAATKTFFGDEGNTRFVDSNDDYPGIKEGDIYVYEYDFTSTAKVVTEVNENWNNSGHNDITVATIDNTIVSTNSRPNDMSENDYYMIPLGAVWVDTTHHKVSILEEHVGTAPSTEFVWNDLPTQASVETDATNTTIDLTLEDNHEYRYTSDVESLTLTMPSGEFLSTVIFQSGTNATQMTYDSGIKWTGDDVVSGAFVPQANKVYDLVFWYNGININGISRGV